MDKVKGIIGAELGSSNAKENPQILITIAQIMCGFVVCVICNSFTGLSDSLAQNYIILFVALGFCIVLPISTKAQVLFSSSCIRSSGFFTFSISVGIILAYTSLFLQGFFIAIWMYLASGLMFYYEYNGISPNHLQKSFKFVVFGLVVMSLAIEVVVLLNFDLLNFISIPVILLLSIWLSYSLITAAIEVDNIKSSEKNDRDSMLEDNLLVWRSFPGSAIKSFPDFINYLKRFKSS